MSQSPFDPDSEEPLDLLLVHPDTSRLVVLELIEENPDPQYCVHGRTKCFGCDRWCHLGAQTIQVIKDGEAMPMCRACAAPIIDGQPLRHVDDLAGGHERMPPV